MWRQWHEPEIADYQRYVYDHLDGAVSALYEYHCSLERVLPPEKIAYGGIPVDTRELQPVGLQVDGPVRLFLGRDRTRMLMKGSDLLEDAARIALARHPGRAELTLVENRPYAEFIQLLKGAHVVLDQIYSYTPATTALMAMAYGLNTVSGGEPDFYRFIGETDNQPIINAPTELEPLGGVLSDVVAHPEEIAERGRRSRQFVEKHNACEVVARRFLDFWTSKL